MKVPPRVQRVAVLVLAFAGGLWAADRMFDAGPATRPTDAPATQPTIEPAAQAVLDRMASAYARRPTSVEATLAIDFEVAGRVDQRSSNIHGAAISSTRFSHEIEGELRIVADDDSVHLYDVKQNQYLSNKLDKSSDRPAGEDVYAMLREQNPAMLFVLQVKPQGSLFVGGEQVSLESSSDAMDVLAASDNGVKRKYFVDRKSGLLDHVESDFAGRLSDGGAREIKRATTSIHYSKTSFDAKLDAAAFAFKPPADAVEASAARAPHAAGRTPDRLVGKPAPAFTLKDLDGKPVSLEGLKGKVVVIDFWATWCGPCVQSLPILNAVAGEYAAKGVVVLAVDIESDSAAVKSFIDEKKLSSLHVLMDDQNVADQFGVSGIPQSFVIGRDGKVLAAHTGYSSDLKEKYVGDIEAALK